MTHQQQKSTSSIDPRRKGWWYRCKRCCIVSEHKVCPTCSSTPEWDAHIAAILQSNQNKK